MKLSDLTLDAQLTPSPEPVAQRADATVEELLRAVVARDPEAVALTDDTTSLTFAQLDEFSTTVARFIQAAGPGGEAAVGVLCRRGAPYLAAAIGALRAGAIYLPVELELSPARQEIMLRPARLLVTDRHGLRAAEFFRYRNPGIGRILCIDAPDGDAPLEKCGELSSTGHWEKTTQAGSDQGWRDWFYGAPLPASTLEELAESVLATTGLRAMPRRRVLDVGGGSGAVARALAGEAEHYTLVDLARNELSRAESLPSAGGVTTHQMEAVDIGYLDAGESDLVVLNGVVENFPGYNYLRRVLDHAVALLAEGGAVFIGAVPDLDERETLRGALTAHARESGDAGGLLRLDAGEELFVPRRFFTEWAAERGGDVRIDFSRPKVAERGLAGFHLDVVIRKSERKGPPAARARLGMDEARRLPAFTPPDIAPERTAYIVYTSGSTGAPKGVVVEHRNLLHILRALGGFSKGCRSVGLVAPLSFDASIQQLAVSVFQGKPLHVMSDEARKSPAVFRECVRRRGVDLCDMTPAFFNVLADHLHEHRLSLPVARLLLAGEVLRPDAIRKFYAVPGNESVVLFNVYGPTECTVDSTSFRIDFANHADFSAYPIGAPLTGVEVSVRSADGHALPDGETGELWITGDGVSRGYLNGECPGAFVTLEGRPAYRTGDHGCWRDGLLRYAGRKDQQVKIRGNRVEIGEVENAIAGFPGVRQVAVVADTFRAEEGTSLAAYVVGEADADQLRVHLERGLPQYCVPAYFVPMVELPFSINRKVDRKALPSPLADKRATGGRKPTGEVEEKLAAIWRRLLGFTVEDAEASFFRLGGNSIMAIRLVAGIEKELGAHVAVGELFTNPSIEKLARIVAGKTDEQKSPVIELCRREGAPALFLFHPVGGSVFCYSDLAESLGGRLTVYAVEAAGFRKERTRLNTELGRVEDLAEYYLGEILKTRTRDIIFGGWSFGGLLAYEAACRYAALIGKPRGVVILDSVADNRNAKRMAGLDEIGLLKSILGDIFDEEVLRPLPRERKLSYLIERGESAGMLPSGFSPAQMDNLVRTYQSNALAAARYDTPTQSDLSILLVRALDFTGNPQIVPDDEYQGWSRFLKKENITIKWTEGTHQSMLSPGLAGNIANLILEYFQNR